MRRTHHRFVAAAVALACAVAAPAASAAITPTVTLKQSTTQAGATASVSLDLKFAPTGSDSPKDLTVALPPGLLADASIDHGACLTGSTAVAACQVGTGTVTASPIVLGLATGVPVSINVGFYLVAPPQPGDLAGVLTVANPGTALASSLGGPADVTVRGSGDPAGVGLTERFSNLPDTFNGLSIGVTELDSTFTGLRVPATCPVTPAAVGVAADSYADASTRTARAPLKVTGCASLPFAPHLAVSATRDTADSGTQVVTDITQPAGDAPSRSTTLILPPAVLAANAGAVLSNGLLCSDPRFVTCQAIGSATSVSPLYPTPLTGQVYLTGALTAPVITIRFPAPFPLTLSGVVTLSTGSTAFTNLPDIPLSDLKVTLTGGPAAAFAATCAPATGTATGALTTQNGDLGVTTAAAFTVANCAPGSGSGGAGGGGSGAGHGGGATQPGGGRTAGVPSVGSGVIQGLGRGRPGLRFTATAGRGAPKLASVTVGLPRGLSLIVHRVHGRVHVFGVAVRGARIAALTVSHGRLIIRLRAAVTQFTVVLNRSALRESGSLRRSARHRRVHRLTGTTRLVDRAGRASALRLIVTRIRS